MKLAGKQMDVEKKIILSEVTLTQKDKNNTLSCIVAHHLKIGLPFLLIHQVRGSKTAGSISISLTSPRLPSPPPCYIDSFLSALATAVETLGLEALRVSLWVIGHMVSPSGWQVSLDSC